MYCNDCGLEIKIEIYKDFRYCHRCCTAFRMPETIASDTKRVETYNEQWVVGHNSNPLAGEKAELIVDTIKQVTLKGRVLDIGCGSGLLVDKLCRNGYNAEGIDWSEPAIDFARKNMKGFYYLGEENLDVLKAYQDYDIVVASHILEHLVDPSDFFEAVKRVLKPDGWLVVAVPNLAWYKKGSLWRSVSSLFDPEHVICYSPRSLYVKLKAEGYGNVRITTKTHGTTLLTALCIGIYHKLVKTEIDYGSGQGQVKQTMFHWLFNMIMEFFLLKLFMRPFNKMTENNNKGMELIASAMINETETNLKDWEINR